MEGIEKITQKIDADVQAEIDALTAAAVAEAAEITARFAEQAQREAQQLVEKGKVNAALREERLASVAALEARKCILGAKQELVGEAFTRALQRMTTLPEADYIALLAGLAAAASSTGHESVIFSQKDRTRFGKQVVSAANDILAKKVAPKLPSDMTGSKVGAFLDKVVTGASAVLAGTAMLTLDEESRPMAGGLVLRAGRVETNCSFEVLIHLQRDSLAAEVAKVLLAQ